MKKYIELFYKYMGIQKDVTIVLHWFDSREELYKARVELTKDINAKNQLIAKKNRYISSEGCFIIPPLENGEYDILLVKTELFLYNLWHEMVHVYNYNRFRTENVNFIQLYANREFCEWDEFVARKISTVMFYRYIEDESGEKYNIQSYDYFSDLAKLLKSNISEDEYLADDIERYDLMQYLGFVAASQEICKEFTGLLDDVKSNQKLWSLYNKLNG